MNNVYPPCKYCGKSHEMSIENRETGEMEPMDICYDCLSFGKFIPIIKQIEFDDLPQSEEISSIH